MICKTCGRNIQNEEANFCEYCGSSFQEFRNPSFNSVPIGQMQGQVSVQMPEQNREPFLQQIPGAMPMNMTNTLTDRINSEASNSNKPISFLNWLASYGILIGLLFIPIIGIFCPIIMLCIWSFRKETPDSKKNWARVTLIFAGLLLILIFAYCAFLLLYTSVGQQILNGTFDVNSYYNSIYNIK